MDEQSNRDAQAPRDARRTARDLLRRTAPVLRDVNARLEQHEALRGQRDALVERAGELVSKADRALKDITAIEGTVVDRSDGSTPGPTPGPAPATPTPTAEPEFVRPSAARQPHWTRERVARMATAAATEAVRPHAPVLTREWKLQLGAVLVAIVAFVLLRRR